VHVLGFLTFLAGANVELDALTLFQVAVTLHVDSRVVDEDIGAIFSAMNP
jgi:hypothetical protein